MQKLTEAEVSTQWYLEHPGVVALPSAEDLKRMRGTMLKRAERLRKKNAVGLTAATRVRPTLKEVLACAEAVKTLPVHSADEELLPPAVQALVEMVNPVPDTHVVALGTSTGFPFPDPGPHDWRAPHAVVVDKDGTRTEVPAEDFTFPGPIETLAIDAVRSGLLPSEEDFTFPGPERLEITPATDWMTEEEKQECRLDQQDDAAGAEAVPAGFSYDVETAAALFDVATTPAPDKPEVYHPFVHTVDKNETITSDVPAPVKRRYTMVPVLSGGQPLADVVVDAINEKEANKLTWAGLSGPQKDNCEYIDCVDVKDIAAATKPVLVIAHGSSAAIAAAIKAAESQPGTFISLLDAKPISPAGLAAKYAGAPLVYAGLDLASTDAVDQAETILSDAQPTKEDTVKKPKKSTKVGKRTPREEIVKSAAFIALFEKAIAKSRDPKRTHCKNGHTITAAHAHVGDMQRTGRYTCDPCNQDAQAKYNGGK